MSSLALAEVLAARDEATTKVDAVLALLECLEELDGVDHTDLARTLQPIEFLADAILGEVEVRKEDHEKLVQESASAEEEIDRLRKLAGERAKGEHGSKVAELQTELAKARAELDAAKATIAGFADMLAMARRFVSAADAAGLKPRHARATRKAKP